MIETVGNLWTYLCDARCVPTNGIIKSDGSLVMGAGVAKAANRRFPGLARRLGELVGSRHGNIPFYFDDIGIISFPTKRHWRDKSSLELIARSANHLKWIADEHRLSKVALPRVGCGMGGLDWKDVKSVLAAYLDDRFVVVGM